METNNNQINMGKVQSVLSQGKSVAPFGGLSDRFEMFKAHKKTITLVCFLVVVIGILTYLFKDAIFKNLDSGTPETYQEAIDQSFKEGYKTDYTYSEADLTRTSVEMQKASTALSKKKAPTDAKKKALLDRINN